MPKVEFKLNRSGVRELMRSDEMMAVCKEYADKALGRLADGYESTTFVGKNRVNASVVAVSREARKEVYETNSILKALQ